MNTYKELFKTMTADHSDFSLGAPLSSSRFPVRWGEMDAMGHVNNAAYLRYFEESRIIWSETLGIRFDGIGEGMILLKASVTYLKQLSYPANIEVTLFAGNIGRTSFHLLNTLTVESDSTPAATGDFVIVWFDYRSNKSAPIPATLRAVLEGAKGST